MEINEGQRGERPLKTTCGGQAILEGIMMRGPRKQAIVVRTPEGKLEIQESTLRWNRENCPALGIPVLRGVLTFFDAMVQGVKALMFSAQWMPEEEQEKPSPWEKWLEQRLGSEKATSFVVTLTVILGIGLSIGLFFFLPTLLGSAVLLWTDSMAARTVAESLLKVVIFVGYLGLTARVPEIHRVFQYHGAEHKTIFCYEAGLPLTLDHVRRQPRYHPRCGTSFLFMVIALSILVSTLVFSIWPVHHILLRFLVHLVLLPIIVGLSYEINRWAGRQEKGWSRWMTAPGLWLQRFTTAEPEDAMLEVGICALKRVIPENPGEDAW